MRGFSITNKRINSIASLLAVALVVACAFLTPAVGEEMLQVAAAIGINSKVSDGQLSIARIAEIVERNNFKILILSDRDRMLWEYGVWPLRNIFKMSVEHNSVSMYGNERYLHDIFMAQSTHRGMIIIPSVESAPFYYWQWCFSDRCLLLKDWHKHILAVGLSNADDYRHLPVIGNRHGLELHYGWASIKYIWPLLVVILGFMLFRRGRRLIGAALLIAGALLMVEIYPFTGHQFDQYAGELGMRPYQTFIDYVDKRGGLTFWLHPEVENLQKIGSVKVQTPAYPDALEKTDGYTGYAIFYEGYKKVGSVGGVWDEMLKRYCRGERRRPVWAIGTLGFGEGKGLEEALGDLRTILLMKHLDMPEALSALREGRSYVMVGRLSNRFVLDSFVLRGSSGEEAIAGGELITEKECEISIKGHLLDGQGYPLKIKLLKDGDIIQTFDATAPFELSFRDPGIIPGRLSYYRAEIEGNGIRVVTNPIFIKCPARGNG